MGAYEVNSRLKVVRGGSARTQVILMLAGVLALSSADAAMVGASAMELRYPIEILLEGL